MGNEDIYEPSATNKAQTDAEYIIEKLKSLSWKELVQIRNEAGILANKKLEEERK